MRIAVRAHSKGAGKFTSVGRSRPERKTAVAITNTTRRSRSAIGWILLGKKGKDSGELQHEFVTLGELCRFTLDQQRTAAKTTLQAQHRGGAPLAF
jgi:hypothetical protein